MRKLLLVVSAFGVLGLVVPLAVPAQAEEGRVVIREHRDHPRFFERFHRHDFFDRYHHHDRGAVIVKKRVREY